jgi:hypothetical protein
MVRLVFRPYTQVWRTICTSVSLRASTRVSTSFTLLRHSSPSFGSQQVCSYSYHSHKMQATGRSCKHTKYPQAPSKLKSLQHLCVIWPSKLFTFVSPLSFQNPRELAHMLDSLVRVSRRVGSSHLKSQNRKHSDGLPAIHGRAPRINITLLWESEAQIRWPEHLKPMLRRIGECCLSIIPQSRAVVWKSKKL